MAALVWLVLAAHASAWAPSSPLSRLAPRVGSTRLQSEGAVGDSELADGLLFVSDADDDEGLVNGGYNLYDVGDDDDDVDYDDDDVDYDDDDDDDDEYAFDDDDAELSEEAELEQTLHERTWDSLDLPVVLAALGERCATARGRRAAVDARGALAPSLEVARARLDAVSEVWRLREPLPLGNGLDVDDALDRAARGRVLEAAELSLVSDALDALDALARWAGGWRGWRGGDDDDADAPPPHFDARESPALRALARPVGEALAAGALDACAALDGAVECVARARAHARGSRERA